MKPYIKLAILGALFGCSGAAHAALSCSVTGVSLNFGVYDDSSPTATDVSTTFSVSCCRNPPGGNATLNIALGASINSSSINTRQMKNTANSDLMSYQLYISSFGGTVWGDGVSGGSTWSQAISTNSNCPGTVPFVIGSAVFGRIFAQQPVSAGTYGDTLTITITP